MCERTLCFSGITESSNPPFFRRIVVLFSRHGRYRLRDGTDTSGKADVRFAF